MLKESKERQQSKTKTLKETFPEKGSKGDNLVEEKVITQISLLLFLIGLVYLSLYYFYSTPIKVSRISESLLGQKVELEGVVTDKTVTSSSIILILSSETKAFVFQSEGVTPAIGDNVTVIGTVELYRNELEIVVSDIEYD